MKFLLVNPWIYDFAAYDFWIKPYGLLQIARILKDNGFEIHLIDCTDRYHPDMPLIKENPEFCTGKFYAEVVEKPDVLKFVPRKYKRYGLKMEIFLNEIEKIVEPDFILVTSVMTYWYPGVFEAVKILKNRFRNSKIIIGGFYASLYPVHAKLSGADFVIAKRNLKDVSKELSKIIGKDLKVEDDFPLYDLYPDLRHIGVMTSIGCPFRCTYCSTPYFFPKMQFLDIEKIFYWIEYYYEKFNVRNIAFYDDALLFRAKEHILRLLNLIIDKGLKINFHTPNGLHARFIDKEVAVAMFKSGFKTIRVSLESSDPARQKETGGKVYNEDLIRAIENLCYAGYSPKDIGVYVMYGLPGQTVSEVLKSMEFVNSLGAKIYLTEYSPIPGTKDWENCKIKGKDPLLQNNTVYPYFELRPEEIEYLKQKRKELNSKLF